MTKAPQSSVLVLPEPELEFRYGQRVIDPHDGLSLFGPCDADSSSHPMSIRYGIVGTTKGIDTFIRWAGHLIHPISAPMASDARIWPTFPGIEAAFDISWPDSPVWTHAIDVGTISTASRQVDRNRRAYSVVDCYLNGIRNASKRDDRIDVILCIVPEEVWKNCRPESKVENGVGQKISGAERRQRAAGQLHMFDDYDPDLYRLSVDFRRQLKARAMEYGIPIQIVRETTLVGSGEESDRGLTPLSDRAWNLSTALYYKAGGKPWKLPSAREGVCYIGIAFRKTDEDPKGNTACCAAQMFLDSGDGIVFLGEYGPWYSHKSKEYHLKAGHAEKLLRGVLDTYQSQGGKPLREIFLHSRSGIDDDEFREYSRACPPGVKVVGIRVRPDHDVRLFRPGTRVVLRGTFWEVGERTGYLWASGFKPRMGTYDGWDVPVPLRIDIQHGEGSILPVAQDILALTKLNYNACKLGDSQPVTVGFSDAVGEILVSNRGVEGIRPNFKFYI